MRIVETLGPSEREAVLGATATACYGLDAKGRGEQVKFARLGARGDEQPAALGDDGWYDLRPVTSDIDGEFLSGDGTARARTELHNGRLPRIDDADALRVGPPVARPGKIVCIGLNYRDHAAETNAAIPSEPVVFLKDPSTVIGPYDEILIPRGSTKTDWEVELGVVIGRTARYLESPDEALGARRRIRRVARCLGA